MKIKPSTVLYSGCGSYVIQVRRRDESAGNKMNAALDSFSQGERCFCTSVNDHGFFGVDASGRGREFNFDRELRALFKVTNQLHVDVDRIWAENKHGVLGTSSLLPKIIAIAKFLDGVENIVSDFFKNPLVTVVNAGEARESLVRNRGYHVTADITA